MTGFIGQKSKYLFLDNVGPRWTMLDHVRPSSSTLVHVGPCSSMFDHVRPTSQGSRAPHTCLSIATSGNASLSEGFAFYLSFDHVGPSSMMFDHFGPSWTALMYTFHPARLAGADRLLASPSYREISIRRGWTMLDQVRKRWTHLP